MSPSSSLDQLCQSHQHIFVEYWVSPTWPRTSSLPTLPASCATPGVPILPLCGSTSTTLSLGPPVRPSTTKPFSSVPPPASSAVRRPTPARPSASVAGIGDTPLGLVVHRPLSARGVLVLILRPTIALTPLAARLSPKQFPPFWPLLRALLAPTRLGVQTVMVRTPLMTNIVLSGVTGSIVTG